MRKCFVAGLLLWTFAVYAVDNDSNFEYLAVQTVGEKGVEEGRFNHPTGIMQDHTGNFYVTDSFNGRIQKYDRSFNFERTYGGRGEGVGMFKKPSGIGIDPQGNIYVSDWENRVVQKMSPDGNFSMHQLKFAYRVETNSEKLFPSENFREPKGIAVDGNGIVYVVEGNRGIAVDENFIYIADKSKVQKYNKYDMRLVGEFGSWGSGDGQFMYPEGVAVDGDGRIFVADTWNDRIQVFDNKGKFLCKFGERGKELGKLSHPKGITVAGDGSVYVSEYDNHRIQKFAPKFMLAKKREPLNESYEWYYHSARRLHVIGYYKEAVHNYRNCVKMNPEYRYADRAQYFIGECYYKLGDYTQTLLDMDRLMKNYPESGYIPEAMLKMARSYESLGLNSEAMKTYTRIQEEYSSSGVNMEFLNWEGTPAKRIAEIKKGVKTK